MKATSAIFLVALIMSCAGTASAHGVVGDYVFLEPLVAEDPTPANELDLPTSAWVKNNEANDYSVGFELEKVLYRDEDHMPIFSLSVDNAWHHLSPYKGASADGFENLGLAAKWAFFYSLKHEFLMSTALVTELPVGAAGIREQSHTSLGPEFLWEKGFGDLPNLPEIKFLRPFGIQSDVGYLPALGGHTSHDLFADGVLEYSLRYLSNNVHDIGLRPPLRNLYLFTELNYNQLVTGPSGETFPGLVITPGLAYVGYHFQISVGTQLALNNASVGGTHSAVLGLLDIFYDSIMPRWGNWTLNRGFGE